MQTLTLTLTLTHEDTMMSTNQGSDHGEHLIFMYWATTVYVPLEL